MSEREGSQRERALSTGGLPFASSADLAEKEETLETLGDGVYALTAEGDPNVGAVEGEDFLVAFEARATQCGRAAARPVLEHTDKPVRYSSFASTPSVRAGLRLSRDGYRGAEQPGADRRRGQRTGSPRPAGCPAFRARSHPRSPGYRHLLRRRHRLGGDRGPSTATMRAGIPPRHRGLAARIGLLFAATGVGRAVCLTPATLPPRWSTGPWRRVAAIGADVCSLAAARSSASRSSARRSSNPRLCARCCPK